MNKLDQFATMAIHAGKEDIQLTTKPETPPIYQTSVFTFRDIDHVDEVLTKGGFIYSRYNNPNREMLAQALIQLCGAEACVTTASGMGAIAAALLAAAKAGERIIAGNDIYGGTYTLLTRDFAELGIEVDLVNVFDLAVLEEALQQPAAVVYLETITNPTMMLPDMASIIKLAHRYGTKVIVDNTFASPYVFRPLEWGADVVVHSLTKYINGHSDVTAGAVLGSAEFCYQANEKMKMFGASLAPFDAWLTLRGLKTLPLRMEKICSNALQVAKFLEGHSQITRVDYPGLEAHPHHKIANKQFPLGYGGMLSFVIDGGREQANQFIRNLEMIEYVASLAGLATILQHPASTSHRGLPETKRLALGITDGMIRLSVGIEPAQVIINDINQALARL